MLGSSCDLLPTQEFLDTVYRKQWGTEASYGVGFSSLIPTFHSTTNAEFLCLNSESQFSPLQSKALTASFDASRLESSPVLIAENDTTISREKVGRAKSVFLYRGAGTQREVVTVSSYSRTGNNITTAPLIDTFGRECLRWFNDTSTDWYIGLGSLSSLSSLVVDDDGIILSSSSDILSSIVTSSSKVPATSIELLGSVSSLSPYASVCFGSGVRYQGEAVNTLFLYSVDGGDSLVAFAGQFDTGQTSVSYAFLEVEISFNSDVVVI